ncbi:hypothetical protein Maes01_00360 [Microbulbifer aestuariivivens]|uniref:Periplasmic heavy metal sensor n=1 Tax=Microbulbifer aestuariivivens TaxID=1908308 RepID=A0ABP9WNY6_9GAMM
MQRGVASSGWNTLLLPFLTVVNRRYPLLTHSHSTIHSPKANNPIKCSEEMMMKVSQWKLLAGSAMLAALLGAPLASMADNQPGPNEDGKQRHEQRFQRMADELQLTEDQIAQLKANREANKEQRMAQRQEMRKLREQLRKAIEAGADQATLDQLGAELSRLEIAQMQERQRRHQELEAMLTDEQKAKLEEMKSQRKERGRKGHKGSADYQ